MKYSLLIDILEKVSIIIDEKSKKVKVKEGDWYGNE